MKPLIALVLMASTSVFASSAIEGRYLKVGGEDCYQDEIGVVRTKDKLQILRIYESRGEEVSYVTKEFDSINQGRQKSRDNQRPTHANRMSHYSVVYSNYENILTEEDGSVRLEKRAKNRIHEYSEYMAPGTNTFPNLGAWVARPFEIGANLTNPLMEDETFELEYSGSTLEYRETKDGKMYSHCIFEKKQ